jgi:PAS domain S-box-containing protein
MFDKIPKRQILEGLQDGVIITDTKEEIVFLNEAAENMFGISASKAIGKGYNEVIKERIFAGNRDKKVSHQGKTEHDLYLLTNRRVGKQIPIRHYIQPLENPPGNIIGRIEILREISDVVRLEDALKTSEMRYQGLFEDSKDMIFITDKKGKILEVNRICCASS